MTASEERRISLTSPDKQHGVELVCRFTLEEKGTVYFRIEDSALGDLDAECSIDDPSDLEHLGQWLTARAAEIREIRDKYA